MSEELKPCPFCGVKPEIVIEKIYDEGIYIPIKYASCPSCFVKQSLDIWNHRRPEAELRARVAELEAQTRWIPVSERLPLEEDRVLVMPEFYDDNMMVVVAQIYMGKWIDDDWGEVNGVIKWMPLPEPEDK